MPHPPILDKSHCQVEGCERKVQYQPGICKMHYLRLKRYGRLHSIVNRGAGYTIHPKGYIYVTHEGKPIGEHVLIAQKALGKKLPKGAIVHHVNGQEWDNTPTNLVICPDQAYHALLHKRARELGIVFT